MIRPRSRKDTFPADRRRVSEYSSAALVIVLDLFELLKHLLDMTNSGQWSFIFFLISLKLCFTFEYLCSRRRFCKFYELIIALLLLLRGY